MARFYGEVGYGESVETPSNSGVWTHEFTEYTYQGDIIRNSSQLIPIPDQVNADISISNSVSIVADQFAIDNFMNIKYVRWAGVLWTVTNVQVQRPRLILTLGGVYNASSN
jgi:hypothetical protein